MIIPRDRGHIRSSSVAFQTRRFHEIECENSERQEHSAATHNHTVPSIYDRNNSRRTTTIVPSTYEN